MYEDLVEMLSRKNRPFRRSSLQFGYSHMLIFYESDVPELRLLRYPE